eukprot:TRINITY_DN901_c0_g1_i1.p1 TRINITY_DN901_c0_g1~~TRINITY_DN901_c0_g1_i1.p1  ORF type:complete len:344 (+),score=61.09 TRINITY_DN901_c0_g1_i1:152-1183(+)
MMHLFKKINKKKVPNIEDFYEIGEELGKGAFSVVYEATQKQTGIRVAIKMITKEHINERDMKRLTTEIEIMKKLKHKNIIQLIEVFDSPSHLYLVMELVRGGELFDKIVQRGQYSERDAVVLVRQIVGAVGYMHEHGVCHRDLKPENLLCSGDDEPEQFVRIADFGLSKIFDGGEELRTACGTPDYVAPEVLECKPYDMAVDMWSVGVITYILLSGFTPFFAETHHDLFKKIISLDYDFPSPEWDDVTDQAKEFIKHLLVIDPTKRYTARQALETPWLSQCMDDDNANPKILRRLDSSLSNMMAYNKIRKSSSFTIPPSGVSVSPGSTANIINHISELDLHRN